ncbi:hypothetical protein [Cryptosporangium sp. NPDC048952]|uniref:MmyB family transcriptional regulator n=1 Tax=Cryptosporangium sp. NPDC048952 TaxID=3363961 RepID=UPI0037158BE6
MDGGSRRESVATEAIAFVRAHTAGDGADRDLCELAGELLLGSELFARLWAEHPVRNRPFGTTRFAHPQLGELTLDYEMLALPDPGQWLVVHTAADDSARTALDLLSTLAAAC